MKTKTLLVLIFGILLISSISASRVPVVGSDNETWGDILNDFLIRIAGQNATELNLTMVSGRNIYSSAINSTHITDEAISSDDLGNDSVKDNEIDYSEVTLNDFTNDANYLDKDEGGNINGSVVIEGNLTLIGSYLNATVTNQYLNGSFFPDITNIFDLGSSIFKWANLYVTNIYASKVYSNDWSNVSITESQVSDADWWDADADLSDNEISEGKVNFTTSCGEGNHLYVNGNDLACEVDNTGMWANVSDIATYEGDINVTGTSYLGSMDFSGGNITATNGEFENINVTGTSTLGTMNLEGGNITAEYYCNSTNCYTITELLNNTNNEYTHLSNFTDDLEDRGYTSLSNFTNNQGYYNSSDFVITDYYNKTQVYNKTEIDSNNWINSSDISDSVGNWSADKSDYYNKTEVDSNDNDTTYSAGSNLTLTDTTFSWNSSWVDNLFVRFSEIVSQVGNWTNDKSDYWNTSNDLNTNSNINTTGNITADYFIGDGSELTGIITSTDLSDYWNTSENLNSDSNINITGNLTINYLTINNPATSCSNIGSNCFTVQVNGSTQTCVCLDTSVIANNSMWNKSGSNVYLANSGDNVGIGTDSPSEALEVAGNIYSSNFKEVDTQNLFVGSEAGNTELTGNYNTGIGYGSLQSLTSGDYNMALGRFAGRYLTEGSSNMLIGYGTGEDITTGVSNVAIGTEALRQLTTGNSNIAIGKDTLQDNDNSNNIAIGTGAQQYNLGLSNIGIGGGALKGSSGLDVDNNLAIGFHAGFNVETGADDNIFLGWYTGDQTTTGSGNILIGKDVQTTGATASDELNIGNIIYGDLANGKVGIGTSSPSYNLQVQDTRPRIVAVGSSQVGMKADTNEGEIGTLTNHPLTLMIADTEKVRIDTDGNVGIGTDSPSEKLEVVGIIKSNEGTYSADLEPNKIIFNRDGANYINAGASNSASIKIRIGNPLITIFEADYNSIIFNKDNNNMDTQFRSQTDNYALFVDANTSSVGIGTSSPENTLHINATDGIKLGSGSDEDVYLLRPDVSNVPYIMWDESYNGFAVTDGFYLRGGGSVRNDMYSDFNDNNNDSYVAYNMYVDGLPGTATIKGSFGYDETTDRVGFKYGGFVYTDMDLWVDNSGDTNVKNNLIIGSGTAGTDYTLTFDGETNDGVITWKEDEDYFNFSKSVVFNLGEKIDNLIDGVLRITGDLWVTENLNVTGNITMGDYFCFTNDCSAYLTYNGTCIISSNGGCI